MFSIWKEPKFVTCKGLNQRPESPEKWILPFPKLQILDSSKLKEFADDNFKFDENVGKFFKRVENILGNAGYQHFSSFPTMLSNLPKSNFTFFCHFHFVFCKCF